MITVFLRALPFLINFFSGQIHAAPELGSLATIDCLYFPVKAIPIQTTQDSLSKMLLAFDSLLSLKINEALQKKQKINLCCNLTKSYLVEEKRSGYFFVNLSKYKFSLYASILAFHSGTQESKNKFKGLQQQNDGSDEDINEFWQYVSDLSSNKIMYFDFLPHFAQLSDEVVQSVVSLEYGELQDRNRFWKVDGRECFEAIQNQWKNVFNRLAYLQHFKFGGWYLPEGLKDLPNLKKVDLSECLFREQFYDRSNFYFALFALLRNRPDLTIIFPNKEIEKDVKANMRYFKQKSSFGEFMVSQASYFKTPHDVWVFFRKQKLPYTAK